MLEKSPKKSKILKVYNVKSQLKDNALVHGKFVFFIQTIS